MGNLVHSCARYVLNMVIVVGRFAHLSCDRSRLHPYFRYNKQESERSTMYGCGLCTCYISVPVYIACLHKSLE